MNRKEDALEINYEFYREEWEKMKKELKDVKNSREETEKQPETKAEERVKKKKRRTKIICGILVILLISIIYNEVLPFFILPREIKELNEKSKLPIEFATPLENYDFTGNMWEKQLDYNGVSFLNKKGDYYVFDGFPDLSRSYKLTAYWTENPQVIVLGVRVGDSINKAEKIIKSYGYKANDPDEPLDYSKGRVALELKDEQNKIVGIYIQLYSTDWFHKGNYK
jgi:hypothetical protein